MAGMFIYWYSEGRDRHSYVPFEIYFTGSVTGLSEGGSVRYLGVDVGRVRRIRLDRRSAERVQVIADIDESAPIDRNTTAQLSLMGVTGLLYIDEGQKEFHELNATPDGPLNGLSLPALSPGAKGLDKIMARYR